MLGGFRLVVAGVLSSLLALPAFALAEHTDADGRASSAFRAQRYAEALRLYSDRRAAEGDSPTLTYNIAVAAYRAGNYARAEREFAALVNHEQLGEIARYNLGLVAAARGDRDLARERFREILAKPIDPRLADLARRAVDEYAEPDVGGGEFDFAVEAAVGIGFDSNVYRTPDDDYINLARRSMPLVRTDKHSGFFSPVELRARLLLGPDETSAWLARYRLRARVYWDDEIDNANRYNNTLDLGRYINGSGTDDPVHQFYLGAAFRLVSRNDVDRDDGVDREIRGVDVSRRLAYFSHGVKATYVFDPGRFRAYTYARIEKRNYGNSATVPKYDHTKYAIGTSWRYRLSRADRLRLRFDHTKRDYDERPARNLFGDIDQMHPRREYVDDTLSLSLHRRFNRQIRLGVEYEISHRNDQYLGYDDYVRQSLGLRLRLRPARGIRFNCEAAFAHTEYPRAFAFNNPTAKDKARDAIKLAAQAEYRLSRQWSVLAAVSYREDRTPDARFAYDRMLGSVGLRLAY